MALGVASGVAGISTAEAADLRERDLDPGPDAWGEASAFEDLRLRKALDEAVAFQAPADDLATAFGEARLPAAAPCDPYARYAAMQRGERPAPAPVAAAASGPAAANDPYARYQAMVAAGSAPSALAEPPAAPAFLTPAPSPPARIETAAAPPPEPEPPSADPYALYAALSPAPAAAPVATVAASPSAPAIPVPPPAVPALPETEAPALIETAAQADTVTIPLPTTPQPPTTPSTTPATPTTPPAPVNPTGRTVEILAPLKDRDFILGQLPLRITPEGEISFRAEELTAALAQQLTPEAAAAVTAAADAEGRLTVDQANAATPIRVTYDPSRIELQVSLPLSARQTQTIVAGQDPSTVGSFNPPARFAAYVTTFANLDYVHTGGEEGWADPRLDGVAAFRIGRIAQETFWNADFSDDADDIFTRRASRFVIDLPRQAIRIRVGDIEPEVRGYQASDNLLGFSIARLYETLQPNRNIRPRGLRSFTLTEAADVEVLVNGSSVRRLRLDPGTYNLSDIPFTQGGNDVQIVATDATGRRELADFSTFLSDQALGQGLTEFGVSGGLMTPLLDGEPDYSGDDFYVTGFFRRGMSERLTLGANAQAVDGAYLVGGEAVIATGLGFFGFEGAFADTESGRSGYAVRADFQIDNFSGEREGLVEQFRIGVETRSEDFAPLDLTNVVNPFAWEANAAVSFRVTDTSSLSIGGSYSAGRGAFADRYSVSTGYAFQLTDRAALSIGASYLESGDRSGIRSFSDGWSGDIRLSFRLSPRDSATATYQSRGDRFSASYTRAQREGIGSWGASASADYEGNAVTGAGALSYVANRAELGLSHFTGYDIDLNEVTSSRTSLRAAGSLAFAGGRFAVGRPINDAFAIVGAHESLDSPVEITAQSGFAGEGPRARSGVFGPALVSNIGSYSEQGLVVSAPEAPVGYDLGVGSFRLFPGYRDGYGLTVGSGANVSAVGSLLTPDGSPLSLQSGLARLQGQDDVAPVSIFTNSVGRFGAQGLRPGRWVAVIGPYTYVIDIPEDTVGLFQAGALEPQP